MKKIILLSTLLFLSSSLIMAGELRKLFPLKAGIITGPAGLQRLALPPDVLRQCRPDLSDLRILDARGREIPFILDSPLPQGLSLELEHRVRPRILHTSRSRSASDRQSTTSLESYTLEIPPLPEKTAAWTLNMQVRLREFVARVDIYRIEGDGRRTALMEGESIFRLPTSGASRLDLPLGDIPPGKLEIKLRGNNQAYLSPTFSLIASRTLNRGAGEGVKLEILEKREAPQGTELLLSRPRGFIPRKLLLETSTPTFRRNLSVWDEGSGAGESALARKEIFRIQAIAPVEALEIPLSPARGDRLRLLIENEGSPPLEDIAVRAILPRPVLIFSTRQDREKVFLFFGGGRARPNPYDIEGLAPAIHHPTTASDQLLAVLDPAQASVAALGEISDNPDYDATPALAFAAHPGAKLESRDFRYRRVLKLKPSAEGLVRIPLAPEDLEKLRPDLGDLRIVDSQGFQWAFLRQDRSRSIELPLEVPKPETRNGVSSYSIPLNSIPLSPLRLRMQTTTPFFNRDLRCFGIGEKGGERLLFSTHMTRRDGDPRPVVLSIPNDGLKGLRLEISDGDDAPLQFDSMSLRIRGPELFVPSVQGEYQLLLGSPQTPAPHYEIERIRQTILTVPSAPADCGPLEENPEYSAAHGMLSAAGTQKTLLWAVLILAVLLLAGLTLHSARNLPPKGEGE